MASYDPTAKAIGKLKVTIVEAKDLVNKDGLFGKSDPFVTVKLGDLKYHTSVVKNNLNPKWEESFEFNVRHLRHEDLYIGVFDKDSKTADDPMGDVKIELDMMAIEKKRDAWIKLNNTKHGELHYQLEYTAFK